MSDWIVLPPPALGGPGRCDLGCGGDYDSLLIYTFSDGQQMAVCSERCLINVIAPSVDGVIAGIITPEECDAMSARRAREILEEAGQLRLFDNVREAA